VTNYNRQLAMRFGRVSMVFTNLLVLLGIRRLHHT
jgi:hypothetical protein